MQRKTAEGADADPGASILAMRWGLTVAVVAPALVLAGIGVTHPVDLTPDTAAWWATMHTLLLPVFPLLAVSIWLLLRGVGGPIAWIARIAAFGYAAFYSGLDVLAGIGAGTLVERGASPSGDDVLALFSVGNRLGSIGELSFVIACVTAVIVLLRSVGLSALAGGALLVASAIVFMESHIYWPAGVASMLAIATSFALLSRATRGTNTSPPGTAG